jgi:hypothetical protein
MRSTPRSSPPRQRPLLLALAGALTGAITALSATGCGHPATRQECDEIFNKSAEIELRLQNVTEPKLVAERTAAVRAAKGDELIQRCLGKRITSSAMECVRRATTSETMDECLQ